MPIAMQDFLNSSRLARRILRLDLTGWTKTRFDTNLTRQSVISLNNAKTITGSRSMPRPRWLQTYALHRRRWPSISQEGSPHQWFYVINERRSLLSCHLLIQNPLVEQLAMCSCCHSSFWLSKHEPIERKKSKLAPCLVTGWNRAMSNQSMTAIDL